MMQIGLLRLMWVRLLWTLMVWPLALTGLSVFGQNSRAPENPGGAEPAQATSYSADPRDGIDASGPADTRAAKRLQQAEVLIRNERWDRAQETLLFILENEGGALVRRSNGTLVPVVEEANRLIGELPEEMLQLYEAQYGRAAEAEYQEGVRTGRQELIERVADQFRYTKAGEKALLRLASSYFDRGQFGLALRRYRQIDPERLPSAAQTRMAYALAATGEREKGRALFESLVEAQGTVPGSQPELTGLSTVIDRRQGANRRVSEWLLPFGDAGATAHPHEGEPTLLARWSQPLTHHLELSERARRLTLDLRDDGKAPIPAGVALVDGDRVIARSLEGVRVYSADAGRLLWESGGDPEGDAASESVRRNSVRARQQAMQLRVQFGIDPRTRGSFDPLESSLFRDSSLGLVTSDHDRVYVVESEGSGIGSQTIAGRIGQMRSTSSFQAESNRLVAYDAETGRLAWPQYGALGGIADSVPFDVPLAGYHFFGPPTPVQGQLYIVGEKDGRIELISLDPASGLVRWKQLIAYAQIGVENDPVRAMWAAPVAVKDGVIVCPTTVGWLVGVDQVSHSILWAYRYAPVQGGQRPDEINPAANLHPLNDRWGAGAPMIHEGKVFFTPPEEQRLVCLDLATGELVWQRGKGTYLYAAGISNEVLVLVGTRTVDGLSLSNGVSRWTVRTPNETSRASGRGILTDRRLYLPMHDHLWEIDVTNGTAIRSTALADQRVALGNLVLQGGKLVSLSATGLTVFEERIQFAKSLDQANDSKSDIGMNVLLRKARLLRADGDLEGALGTLDQAAVRVGSDSSDEFSRLRWEVLEALVRSDVDQRRSRINELAKLAVSSDQKSVVRRLKADADAREGKIAEAVKGYLNLLSEPLESRLISEDEGATDVHPAAWIAGRIERLWDESDDTRRGIIRREVREWSNTAEEIPEVQIALNVASLPDDVGANLKRAQQALSKQQIAVAELHLLRTAGGSTEAEIANALLQLAKMSEENGLASDATYWIGKAKQLDAKLTLADGRSLEAHLAELSAVEPDLAPNERWGRVRFDVVRSGAFMTGESTAELEPVGGDLPYFRNRLIRLLPQSDRLGVSGPDGADLKYLIPLQSVSRSSHRTSVMAVGHTIFLAHRGILQAISLWEGKTLWSAPLPEGAMSHGGSGQTPDPLRPAASFLGVAKLSVKSRETVPLVFAGARYVAVRGRRSLSAYDAISGELLWAREGVPSEVDIIGTDRRLYLLPRGDGRQIVLRSSDGSEVKEAGQLAHLSRAIATIGEKMVTLQTEPSFQFLEFQVGGGASLSCSSSSDSRPDWSYQFPKDALFDFVSEHELAVLTPADGTLRTVDLATGMQVVHGAIPKEAMSTRSEAYLLSDQEILFVLVNRGAAISQLYTPDLPAVTANGEIYAFRRGSSEMAWKRSVKNRRLLVQTFEHLPVLLLMKSEQVQKGTQRIWQVDLLALDKRTGETVLEEPFYTLASPFFRSLLVEPGRRLLELSGYSTRIRLWGVDSEEIDETLDEKAESTN